MGNTYKVLRNDLEVEAIAKYGKIPRENINQMRVEFMSAASRDGRMSRNDFYNYYRSTNAFPHGPVTRDMSDRMFEAIDIDKNGFLTFNEFIIAYAMVHGAADPRDKLQFYIQARFDGQVPQQLNEQDMSMILQSFNTIYNVNSNTSSFVQQTMASRGYSQPLTQYPQYQQQTGMPPYQQQGVFLQSQQMYGQQTPFGLQQQSPLYSPKVGYPPVQYTHLNQQSYSPFGQQMPVANQQFGFQGYQQNRPQSDGFHVGRQETTTIERTETTTKQVNTTDFIDQVVKDPRYGRKLSLHINLHE
ncbi:hypothetical protein ACOME3_000433 [Neoechinorhynchus agilis]